MAEVLVAPQTALPPLELAPQTDRDPHGFSSTSSSRSPRRTRLEPQTGGNASANPDGLFEGAGWRHCFLPCSPRPCSEGGSSGKRKEQVWGVDTSGTCWAGTRGEVRPGVRWLCGGHWTKNNPRCGPSTRWLVAAPRAAAGVAGSRGLCPGRSHRELRAEHASYTPLQDPLTSCWFIFLGLGRVGV